MALCGDTLINRFSTQSADNTSLPLIAFVARWHDLRRISRVHCLSAYRDAKNTPTLEVAMMKLTRKSAAFTLVELLVVIAIIALLVSFLMPTLGKMRDASNRIVCASNLRSIGHGFQLYATDNRGNFPRTYWWRDLMYAAAPHTYAGTRAFSNPVGTNPFAHADDPGYDTLVPPWNPAKRPAANDVTAPLFLLISRYRIPAETFICPSRSDTYYPDRFETFAF